MFLDTVIDYAKVDHIILFKYTSHSFQFFLVIYKTSQTPFSFKFQLVFHLVFFLIMET